MNSKQCDPAAIFGSAHSLYTACLDADESDPKLNLSEVFKGHDSLMRLVMVIGERFELWALKHVSFEDFGDVWPYFVQQNFGATCLKILSIRSLESFDETASLQIAIRLGLPLRQHHSP